MEKVNGQFKGNAVNLVLMQSLSVVKVATDLGIGKSTLHRWVCRSDILSPLKERGSQSSRVSLKS